MSTRAGVAFVGAATTARLTTGMTTATALPTSDMLETEGARSLLLLLAVMCFVKGLSIVIRRP